MSEPVLALVVAVARNGVIGRGNALPWHLPEDLQHFKRITMGRPMIMGRRTYDSIGRPLPGRDTIVVSRSSGPVTESSPQLFKVESVDAAVQLASELARARGVDEIMVVGGADIYRQLLPRAERIYRTRVEMSVEGDALFPELGAEWALVSESVRQDLSPACRFQLLEKGKTLVV